MKTRALLKEHEGKYHTYSNPLQHATLAPVLTRRTTILHYCSIENKKMARCQKQGAKKRELEKYYFATPTATRLSSSVG